MNRLYAYRVPLLSLVVCLLAGAVIQKFAMLPALPWVSTGRIVVVVAPTPFDASGDIFSIGLDPLYLVQGKQMTKLRPLIRRVTLDSGEPNRTVAVDMRVRTGTYDGLSLHLTSPEVRGVKEGVSPPESISLAHEVFALPVTVRVNTHETTVVYLSFETFSAMISNQNAHPVYYPVAHVEVRSNTEVSVDESGTVVQGGAIETLATYGMHRDGKVRINYRASTDLEDDVPDAPPLPDAVPFVPLEPLEPREIDEKQTDSTRLESSDDATSTETLIDPDAARENSDSTPTHDSDTENQY